MRQRKAINACSRLRSYKLAMELDLKREKLAALNVSNTALSVFTRTLALRGNLATL